MSGFDHEYARRLLQQHYGDTPIPADDEALLQRFERARTDPTVTDAERKKLKQDLETHPVLGAPRLIWYPDMGAKG
jgi:hypothetical protein